VRCMPVEWRRRWLAFAPGLLMAVALVAGATAADGDLDASFGSGGTVTTDFSGEQDVANALVSQKNGKLVAAGYSGVAFAVTRYNTDGSLDRGFGTGGKVLTHFSGNSFDFAYGVAIQSDGKIVVAGQSNVSGSSDFAVARYSIHGDLDKSFGSGGKVVTDFTGHASYEGAFAILIQSNGKIVLGGVSNATGSADFALARYNTDGSLDTSFGSGGKVTTDFGGCDSCDVATALAIQQDGKIVAAGVSGANDDYFAISRYNSNGSLDTSFGNGGKVLTPFNGFASGVAIQQDGKIVAAGYSGGPNVCNGGDYGSDFALARYNTDGSLDTSFGCGGKMTTDFAGNGSVDQARAVAVQKDAKIVAAGFSGFSGPPGTGYDFALARYDPNGSLDANFGHGGKATTDFGSSDFGEALVVQSDGQIVVAGEGDNEGSRGGNFALARYLAQ
jgi:uncharacterized delta-60 repeat protein